MWRCPLCAARIRAVSFITLLGSGGVAGGGHYQEEEGGPNNFRQGGQSEAIRVWIISASSFITVLGGRGGARQGGITGRGRVGKEIPIWGEGSA